MDCHGAGGGWSFNSLLPERARRASRVRRPALLDRVHRAARGRLRRGAPGRHAREGGDAVRRHEPHRVRHGLARPPLQRHRGRRGRHRRGALRRLGLPRAARDGRRGRRAARASSCSGRASPPSPSSAASVATARGTARPPVARRMIEEGARQALARPDGGAALRPGPALHDRGRVQAHPAGRPAPLPPRRRAARRADDPRRGEDVVGGLEALLLRDVASS